MRCHRVHQLEHLFGQFPDLPLGAAAAAQVEKVLQAAGIHGDHHLGLAGVGQYKAGILVGLLAGLGAGLLFRHSLSHQADGVAFFQFVGKVEVALCVLFHAGKESFLCFRDGFDLGRYHIAEIVQPHIALALHTEGCNAVAGDLRQQSAADPLDAKGEAGMFNGAGMAQIAEHGQELRGLFLGQAVQQVGDVRIGIAELCRCSHHLFRFRGMCDQTNSHHKCVIPPQ